MTDFILTASSSLRPDPDDASPEVLNLCAGAQVSSLREVNPWMKVSALSPDAKSILGWLHSDVLREQRAEAILLYDEPGGEGKPVTCSIMSIRTEFSGWRKVDVRLEDGSVETGWVLTAAARLDEEDIEPHEESAVLHLGPNEVYREFLLTAEARTNIDAAALAALISAEAEKLQTGEWNRNSEAKTSTAAGLTQFLGPTWIGEARKGYTYLNEHAKKKGLVDQGNQVAPGADAKLLRLRFDAELSIVAAAEYGAANLKALIEAGLVNDEIGDDEKAGFIYLAHHEGLSGATGFLKGTKTYTYSDLVTQVGEKRAPRLLDAAHGDANLAYRTWLKGYIDENIQPSKYRRGTEEPKQSDGDVHKALGAFDGQPVPVDELSRNIGLAKAIQWRLSELGYLDPPADGKFGPVSSWALSEFCDLNEISLKDGFTKAIAQRLADPVALLPAIVPGGAWFDRVIAYMAAKKYFICRHPDCKNIVYLEGGNPDGTKNDDAPNQFNDLRIVFSIGSNGVARYDGSIWEGTTEPGRYWTLNPMNSKGAARIAFNQYKAWVVGTHHPNSASAHEALVQIEPITVCRDLNKDFKRTGDELDTGLFAINQHWGYDAPHGDLGPYKRWMPSWAQERGPSGIHVVDQKRSPVRSQPLLSLSDSGFASG